MTKRITDRSRLPKWAQRELVCLERSLAETQRALRVGANESNTVADPYHDQRPLGMNAHVRWNLDREGLPAAPGDREAGSFLDARLTDDGALYLYGGTRIFIEPQASNVVLVRATRT